MSLSIMQDLRTYPSQKERDDGNYPATISLLRGNKKIRPHWGRLYKWRV